MELCGKSSELKNAISQFLDQLSESLRAGTFVRMSFSRPAKSLDGVEKLLARCVDLKGEPHLSLTHRHANRDVTTNLSVTAAPQWAREQLGRFRSALLCTIVRDWQLSVSESGTSRLVPHKPSVTKPPARTHDQPRQGILDDSARDWLHALGVADPNGRVRAAMTDKYRQINRYLEILSHLVADCRWDKHPMVTLADMGCGKGYLTFGAWHLFRRVQKLNLRVIGAEARADLVKNANAIARSIGADDLEFIEATINAVELPRVDALVALHACDTATDQAILRGVTSGARLIVVAPCCHQEIRPQLGHPEPLSPVLRHGLMEERMAEWLTDGLRALFLEWAGYRTKVFEFISTEHTAKNLMISAVRQGEPFASTTARERIERLKNFFGIQHQALDGLQATKVK